MKHWLLLYEVAPDYLTRREAFRAAHLAYATEAAARGDLLLGGALADPADGAVLLFAADAAAVAEGFARADPYVLNGVVIGWRVRAWNTVVGATAAHPLQDVGSARSA
jgi:hypothetical protein